MKDLRGDSWMNKMSFQISASEGLRNNSIIKKQEKNKFWMTIKNQSFKQINLFQNVIKISEG